MAKSTTKKPGFQKKTAETKKPRRVCDWEENETECPKYTKNKYGRTHYCIYRMWQGDCLNHEMDEL